MDFTQRKVRRSIQSDTLCEEKLTWIFLKGLHLFELLDESLDCFLKDSSNVCCGTVEVKAEICYNEAVLHSNMTRIKY